MSTSEEFIRIRLSTEDLQKIRKKMESAGTKNLSAYVRKMALDGYCVRMDLPEMKKLFSLLGHCSGNLNQYAKKANQTDSIYLKDIQDLQKSLDEIYEVCRKILAALMKISV